MKEKIINFYNKYFIKYLLLVAGLYIFKVCMYELSKVLHTDYHIINMKIDSYIPFCKYFIIFYCTYYFFEPILLYLVGVKDSRKFYRLLISVAIACIISNICFAFYQVKMVRPQIVVNDFFDWAVNLIYNIDANGLNCFPSIHAVIGTSMIIGGYKTKGFSKWFQIFSIVCGVGCIVSTVLVKQHYFIDMIVGVVLMIICYLVVYLIDMKRKKA